MVIEPTARPGQTRMNQAQHKREVVPHKTNLLLDKDQVLAHNKPTQDPKLATDKLSVQVTTHPALETTSLVTQANQLNSNNNNKTKTLLK